MKKITLLLLILSCVVFAQKKPFSIEALYKIKNVSAPSISPNGKMALFTHSVSDMKKGKSNADIYMMNLDGTDIKPLLNSDKSESTPMWINDDSFLYYLSGVLYQYSFTSNSGIKVTDYAVTNPVLSNDGKLMAFESEFYPECGYDLTCNKKLSESSENGPVQAYIADELLYRHWTSFKEEREPYVVIFDMEKKEVIRAIKSDWISSNYMLGGSVRYNFSPDGKELCFMSTEEKNLASSTNSDLYIVPVSSGNPVKITTNPAWDGFPVYSPDGKYIAYKLQTVKDFEADRYRIAVYDRENKTTKTLTEDFDYTVDDMQWSDDRISIYFTAEKEGYSPVFKVNVETAKVEEVSGKQSTFGFSVIHNKIFFMSRNIETPSEIYSLEMGSKKVTPLTSFNKEFAAEYDIRPAEQVWIEGANGIKVHTFIVKPHNFDPAKKYPVVFNVHGGPQSQWMDAFRGDWQV